MRWTVINVGVLGLWAAVHVPVAGWLLGALLRADGQLHGVLALIGLVAVARSLDLRAAVTRLQAPPRASLAALGLATVPPLLAAWLQRTLPIDVLAASAAVVSAYGVLGLYLDAGRWRTIRAAALLAAAILPVTQYLDVYLGFPLRRLVAQGVAGILGAAEVTAGTVLAIDGGYAHVDTPCSGVRSLWSGVVVLLGAAAAWRRPVDAVWAGIVALTAVGLVVANGMRVLVLVSLEHLLGWTFVAEVVHVPLGVIGFALAMLPALAAVYARAPSTVVPTHSHASWWAGPTLALAMIGVVACRMVPLPPTAPAPVPLLPASLVALPLDPGEALLAEQVGSAVRKGRFEGTLRGTVVVVSSGSWLAHHVPEGCLEAAGWDLEEDHPARVSGEAVRLARARRGPHSATAVWWFQSAQIITDDHIVRIVDGLFDDTPWVLVSVLIEGNVEPTDPAVASLIDDLRASAARTLEEA